MARTKRLATAFASVALALPLLSTGPAGAAVVNPTSSSYWYVGETHTLRWGALSGTAGTFSIELMDSNGQVDADPTTPSVVDPIASGLDSASVGSYDWTIPSGVEGAGRFIRIVGTGSSPWDAGTTNVDSNTFTIDTLTSGFLSPVPGGEVQPGGSVTVKFVVPSVDATGTAEIALTQNGNAVDLDTNTTGTQDTIATNIDLSTTSSYSWTVPSSLSGSNYRLVLRAGTGGTYAGAAIQSGVFSAVPAGLYEPSATSNWRELETQTIKWSAPVGAAGTVALYLWDGTANVDADPTTTGTQPIATGIDVSTTSSYDWTIPAGITLSNTARIRLVGDGGTGQYTGAAMVSSPFILRAAPPVPRFTVPGTGNRWHPGEAHTITWVVDETATGLADVWLYDSNNARVDTDSATTGVQPLANDIDVTSATTQSWTIPDDLTGEGYYFALEASGDAQNDYTGATITSSSFDVYAVGAADVHIDSAVDSQVAISEKYQIKWHDDGATGTTVDIDLLRNDGQTGATTTSVVKGLAKSTVCNSTTHDCSYTATMSEKTTLDTTALSKTYKVRVTPALGASGKSDAFAVVDRALNVVPWVGNKTAKSGEPVTVQWEPQGNLGTLKIEAVPTSGTAVVLEKAYDASKGTYTWYPGYAFSGDYSLRLTASAKTSKKEAITSTQSTVTVSKVTALTLGSLTGVTANAATLGQPITVSWSFGEALNATTKASPPVDISLLDANDKATKVASGVKGDFDDDGKALRTYTFRPSGKLKAGSYKVQVTVTGSTDAGLTAKSSAVALTAPTTLALDKPEASDSVERGGSLDVEWTWDGKSELPVAINLVDSNGKATALVKSVVGTEGNGKGKTTVTIPAKGTSAGSYKIQVISTDFKTIKAEKSVTLTTPTLAVTSQKTVSSTKAVVYKGKPTEVTWTLGEAGALPVKLEVIAAADKTATKPKVVETISSAAKTVEGAGTVSWTPGTKLTAGDYVIRATASDLSATGVFSDTFTVAIAGIDSVTAPSSAQVGKASTIKWALDQEATDSVKIELVQGTTVVAKGGSIAKSATATLGYGSYSWTIPSSIAAGSYKIRVTSTSDATKTLDSDAFSIAAAS